MLQELEAKVAHFHADKSDNAQSRRHDRMMFLPLHISLSKPVFPYNM